MKHLSQRELVYEGFGSFMKKVGGMAGGAVREFGKQLLKDAPALVGAAKGMAGIIKGGLDTDPLIAVKKYFKDDDWASKTFKDDIRESNSLGKPKEVPGHKAMIDIPINHGTYISIQPDKTKKEIDYAGGRISLKRGKDGLWGVEGVFGKDSSENVIPQRTPVTGGGTPAGDAPGLPPVSPEDTTPDGEIKDSKGAVMEIGDQVEFTKGARELKGKRGAIKSIQGSTNITISVDPGGATATGVDPQVVVKVGGEDGGPPGEPSRPETEVLFNPGDVVSYTNKKGEVKNAKFVKDLGGGKSEVKFAGNRAMAVLNNQLQAAEAPAETEAARESFSQKNLLQHLTLLAR